MPSATERKPDYYIGATGLPLLTSHFTTMHRTAADRFNLSKSNNGASNSKQNKCLYNLSVRNGGVGATFPTGNNDDRHGSIVTSNSRRASNKTEHDITTIPRYSSSSNSSTGGRCSKSPPHRISGSTRDTGRNSFGTAGGWYCSTGMAAHSGLQIDRSRSLTSPPSRLLSARSSMQRHQPTASARRSGLGPPEVSAEGSLVLHQQCRYSNQHKLLDNRLTNQRSYDRNIFGYDQRMDQFVLPPLQI
ncbi:uncharacterized protein LOC126565307 [Anopheles maculipalpis]|uniref:uncharacterized protein LOC126565307 n=1 Tax=Anopheles maculipalpis TaxID=1496333 RepID=UPI00215906AD|nr:uncharacterized protein LOC126565307 [Anopheles maculipalpis]